MNTFNWLDDTFSLRLVVTLAHFLWQGAAVALIVAVCNRLLKRASAHVRYSFNVAALLAMVACLPATFALVEVKPIVTRTALPVVELAAAETSMQLPMNDPTEVASPLPESAALHVELTNSNNDGYGQEAVVPVSPLPENKEARPSSVRAWLAPIAPYLSTAYSIGVTLMMIRLTTALWGGQKLRRISTPVDDESLLAMVERQATKLGMRIAPAVAMCEQISVPLVVGVLKPMILLPTMLASGLSAEQLQALITHELAHIRRYDMAVNLLLRFIEAVLFFHPAVWYVSRRVSIERENAADDMVLAAGWRRAIYADALVRMAELSAALRISRASHHAASLAASGDNASEFKRRVLRVLGQRDVPKVRLTRSGFAVILLVLVSLAMTPTMLRSLEAVPAETQEAIGESEHTDLYGDPLPEGAISRLGTTRFRQQDRIKLARFLPDSKSLMVVTTEGGRLVYYDVPSGKLRKEVKLGLHVVSNAVCTPDGSLLALSARRLDKNTNLMQMTTFVINTVEGSTRCLINEPKENHYINALAISPNGRIVCSAGADGKMRFWDVESSAKIREYQPPRRIGFQKICFSNDSKVVSFAGNTTVALWNWQTEMKPREVSIADRDRFREVRSLVFSPVGESVRIGLGGDGSMIRIDVRSGKVVETITASEQSDRSVLAMKYSKDGRFFAVSQYKGDITISEEVSPKNTFALSGDARAYLDFDFSPDGRWLVATNDSHGNLDVFDLKTRKQLHRDKPGAVLSDQSFKFMNEGETVVSAGDDGQIRFWNTQSGSLRRQMEHPLLKNRDVRWIRAFAVSPDNKLIATSSFDDTVRVWNIATGRERLRLPGHGHLGGKRALSFTPDGKRLISCGDDVRVYIWEVATGNAIQDYRLQPRGMDLPAVNQSHAELTGVGLFSMSPDKLFFSPDGTRLLAMIGSVYVFDPMTGKQLSEIKLEHGYFVGMAISPDNRWLLTSQTLDTEEIPLADGGFYRTRTREHQVTLRSLSDGAIEKQYIAPGLAGTVCFSPDGARFAVATRRGPEIVRIFDTATRQEMTSISPPMFPYRMAFSADNRRLAVGMRNKNTLVWDLESKLVAQQN